MSQPSLYYSSLSGLDGTRFSFSSLSEEGKRAEEANTDTAQMTPKTRRLSKFDALLRSSPVGKRERLSQPTLITGDYYPYTKAHQRLSQPTLGYASKEFPAAFHSSLFYKKRMSSLSQPPNSPLPLKSPPITKKDKMSHLDVGAARYHHLKNLQAKFFRDRFSIPELETQNELKFISGTPKQRFSLDSQLNPKTGKTKSRLLPIASSPIAETQCFKLQEPVKMKNPFEGLQNVLIATATPIFPLSDKNNPFRIRPLSPATPTTCPSEIKLPHPSKRATSLTPSFLSNDSKMKTGARERLSVPEIRNSSLRRLLDPPLMKQRHSITGATPRQGSLADKNMIPDILETSVFQETTSTALPNWPGGTEQTIVEEPKHIQRHYAYTYEPDPQCDSTSGSTGLGKVGRLPLPRKKFLESNFDEKERVITTVIETEIPLLLSSPKYSKKTHAYASEPPKWMKKCMGISDNYEKNEQNKESDNKMEDSEPKPRYLCVPISPGKSRRKSTIGNMIMKSTPYIRLEPSTVLQESPEPCEIVVNMPNWPAGNICQVYELSRNDESNSDSDSECSTSI